MDGSAGARADFGGGTDIGVIEEVGNALVLLTDGALRRVTGDERVGGDDGGAIAPLIVTA